MQITNVICPTSKYPIKCPYEMTPEFIVVHNTANDASAMSEISYMLGNNNKVSFHAAVDNERVVTGIPFNRNTWNAGDGGSGIGYNISYTGGNNFQYDSICTALGYSSLSSSGGGQAHNNLQPYITCYMWKRTN